MMRGRKEAEGKGKGITNEKIYNKVAGRMQCAILIVKFNSKTLCSDPFIFYFAVTLPIKHALNLIRLVTHIGFNTQIQVA